MVLSFCKTFGEKICSINGVEFFTFPTLDKLYSERNTLEQLLRTIGFGYRSKYIAQTVALLFEDPSFAPITIHPSAFDLAEEPCKAKHFLLSLRTLPYKETVSHLTLLSGVGRKVADCVCLFSLDKHTAVPIDTHVWQIACRDYKFSSSGRKKSLTATIYDQIHLFFNELFKFYPGWAHSLLFVSELNKFK